MNHRVPDDELPDFDDMDPRFVRRELRDIAADVRGDLAAKYGEVPTRERRVDVSAYDFPADPDDLFPWAAVALVFDAADRVLLLRHEDHDYAWEPPGGKGEYDETPAGTAAREVREETGVDPDIADLLLVETLQFDYGIDVTAPVVQAVFAGRVDGEPAAGSTEDAIPEARWFAPGEVPDDAQFRGRIRTVQDGTGGGDATDREAGPE